MGHYYAEICPNGKDNSFREKYVQYKQNCKKEVLEIIRTNPIQFEEISIGDNLVLYAPLKSLSKIRFEDKGEYHLIKEIFKLDFGVFGFGMNCLYSSDSFNVYNKRRMNLNFPKSEWYEARVDNPIENFPFPNWIDIKYFDILK